MSIEICTIEQLLRWRKAEDVDDEVGRMRLLNTPRAVHVVFVICGPMRGKLGIMVAQAVS